MRGRVEFDMGFAPFAGEADLFLALAEAVFVGVGGLVDALMTGHAVFIFGTVFILWKDRAAAAIAQLVATLFEAMADRDPRIKDKAIAVPCALFLGDFL